MRSLGRRLPRIVAWGARSDAAAGGTGLREQETWRATRRRPRGRPRDGDAAARRIGASAPRPRSAPRAVVRFARGSPLARALGRLDRDVHGHPRRLDRQHRAAEHRARVRRRPRDRRVGRRRLPPRDRQPAPPVRSPRRGGLVPAGLPGRVRRSSRAPASCAGRRRRSSVLIAFRALQGIGAAMLMAMGPAIVARTFGPGERGRALGLNAISVSIGLSLGPALGGLLTELATWRAIFLVNVPIGLIAIAWAARVLPVRPTGPPGAVRRRRGRACVGRPVRPPARPEPGRVVGLDEPADGRAAGGRPSGWGSRSSSSSGGPRRR